MGNANVREFLSTIDLSEFKITIEQRKEIAKLLQAAEASQRATAKVLGVDKETVARDLGTRGANAPPPHQDSDKESQEIAASPVPGGANAPAWFQSDADPTREAKRLERNQQREADREQPDSIGDFRGSGLVRG